MNDPSETRISGSTFLFKFIFPVIFFGFGLCWAIGVGFIAGPKGSPPVPLLGLIALAMMASAAHFCFIPYHAPLKEVWLGERGMRISDFRSETIIPYEAVESIRQMTQINLRYVIVSLKHETIFGDQFTFIPRASRCPGRSPPARTML